MKVDQLSMLERNLLDGYQKDFPLEPRPYAAIARRLDCDEATLLELLRQLQRVGIITRVGPVFAPHRAGASTLAAMKVPADRLESVAALVSDYDEVNHNYEREHDFNLWFVVAAPSGERVAAVLDEVRARTGLAVMDLPLEQAFHIDLGFALQWN